MSKQKVDGAHNQNELTSPRNFVILSQQRVGSHMLLNLLNSHPQILCNSDIATADIVKNGESWTFRTGFSVPPTNPERVYFPEAKRPDMVGFLLKTKGNLHQNLARRG